MENEAMEAAKRILGKCLRGLPPDHKIEVGSIAEDADLVARALLEVSDLISNPESIPNQNIKVQLESIVKLRARAEKAEAERDAALEMALRMERELNPLRDLINATVDAFDGWYGDDMHENLSCVFGCNAHPKNGDGVGLEGHEATCLWAVLARHCLTQAKGATCSIHEGPHVAKSECRP